MSKKNKILIVDDTTQILDILTQGLEDLDCEIITKTSGEEAIKVLEFVNVGIVLTDIEMPGMSGIELCDKVRANNSATFVFAMTGHYELYTLASCRAAGFDDFFSKPLDFEALKFVLSNSLVTLERWCQNDK